MSTAERTDVERLLEQVEHTRQRLYVAQAYGVRPAGLRDLKSELREVQQRLAEL